MAPARLHQLHRIPATNSHEAQVMNVKSFVQFSLDHIRSNKLHGIDRSSPTGYLRGLDTLGADFENGLWRSCKTYLKFHGSLPNLIAPSSFTEKQLLFKFFAPIPIIATSDKLGSRAYSRGLTDAQLSKPKVIWRSKTANLPQNDAIPAGRYWLKSNHSSGTNMAINFPLDTETKKGLETIAEGWLRKIHNRRLSLWWYEMFDKVIYLEEDLSEAEGHSADDWKFFVFKGKVALFQHDKDRFGDHVQTIYRRDGSFIDRELYFKSGQPIPIPDQMSQMIKVAEHIGASFDFMRVDLFLHNDAIYLGEIGLVPNGCSMRIRSPVIDHLLGASWSAPWLGKTNTSKLRYYDNTLCRTLYDEQSQSKGRITSFTAPWA